MFGLSVGSLCPQLMHERPRRLRVHTRHVIGSPDGKRRIMVGGPGDPEWDEIDYLFCFDCGLKFHAAERGKKVEDFVLASMDPSFRFTPRVVEDSPLVPLRDDLGDLVLNLALEDPSTQKEIDCAFCGNPGFLRIRPSLTIDCGVTSELSNMKRFQRILALLIRPYHFCAGCLAIREEQPRDWTITKQEFAKLVEVVFGNEPPTDCTDPEFVLAHLRAP